MASDSGAEGASSASASSSSSAASSSASKSDPIAIPSSSDPKAGSDSTAKHVAHKGKEAAPSSPPSNSYFWSSWTSPSSTAASAASSAFESRKTRPTFEEFRAQEPPQARLIRLRGLFDTLLHLDDDSALAGGRARKEWTKSAMRARYGAGGSLARGSMAPKDDEHSPKNAVVASTSPSDSTPRRTGPPPPPPPRQSYAKELLAQCRQCRLELDQERQRELDREAAKNEGSGWGWPSALTWGSSEKTEETKAAKEASIKDLLPFMSSSSSEPASSSASTSSPSSSTSSLLSMFSSSSPSSSEAESDVPPDHEGEAGWTGSRVWGLSAVGSKQRDRNRELDERLQKGEKGEEEGSRLRELEWEGFLKYADGKERELYKLFSELDKNTDMRLDVSEIRGALDRAGIELAPLSLEDFIASLASSDTMSHSHSSGAKAYVTFPEFRDYLLLLPRKPSVNEIVRFYQVRKAFGLFAPGGIFAELGAGWGRTERGASALTFDGDVSLAGEERSRTTASNVARKEAKKAEKGKAADTGSTGGEGSSEKSKAASATEGTPKATSSDSGSTSESSSKSSGASAPAAAVEEDDEEEDEEDDNDMIHGAVAVKFLLAGGIAGAVSRTATAPFDRLKIYLITTAHESATKDFTSGKLGANPAQSTAKLATKGASILTQAIKTLYVKGGGLKAFWLGNGLNCVKIFPESAIKFLSYETSKRAFAKYVDGVSDSRDISGTSRFMSGGIGGITSQLAIYPIETLKTRLMSSQGRSGSAMASHLEGNALIVATARDMWKNGGVRLYYRGLAAGLVGVFPYSAIDMSAFEGIKLFYIKYTGREEPGVFALLSFGAVSGSVGASTVYPLNLVRTRLQAAGTPAHPATYDGFADAVRKTYRNEGFVGFYRGLVPTLAKVVPAVSISYVVYEQSKRRLGVQ